MRLVSASLTAGVFFSICLTAGVIYIAVPAFAQTAKLLGKFEQWQVFIHETQNEKVCFAASQPRSMAPKGAKRGSVYFYLTTWAKDGIRNEVSVKVGYPLKPDSKPVILVGRDQFELYPKDDKAFMRDPGDERKLIEAMKKGSILTVKGLSARGTHTTDQYSLAGVTAALAQIGTACP